MIGGGETPTLILPAVKKGFSILNYKVYLLLVDEDGIMGLPIRRLITGRDVLVKFLLGILGGAVGRLTLGGGTGGEGSGTLAGIIAFSSILDEEIKEKAERILKANVKAEDNVHLELLVPLESIRDIELRDAGVKELCTLKIKMGWRGVEFMLRRAYGEALFSFIERLIKVKNEKTSY